MNRRITGITISIIVALSVLLAAFGCQKAAPTTTAPAQTPAASPKPAPAPSPSPSPSPSPAPAPKPAPAPSPTAPPPAQAKVWNLKMQNMFTSTSIFYKDVTPKFIERIQKGTNGRVKIEQFPPGALVPTAELSTALGNKVLDVAAHAAFYEVGKMPTGNFAHWVPFSTKFPNEWETYMYRLGQADRLREAYAKFNIFYVGPFIQTGYGQLMSKKPVKTLADVKGMKVRAGGAIAKMWESFGTSSSLVPLGELYTSMSTGIIDAAAVGPEATMVDLKLYEVAKYFMLPFPCPTSGSEIDVNMDLWKEFPDDIKEIFIMSQKVMSQEAFETQAYANADGKNLLLKNGVQFITLSDADVAELSRVARSQWDSLATDDISKKSLQVLKDYVKFLGY